MTQGFREKVDLKMTLRLLHGTGMVEEMLVRRRPEPLFFHFKKEALHSQHRLGIFIAVLNYDMLKGIGQRQVSYLCQKIAKKYFNPDKPSRDQGKYYLKLLQFSKRRAFVFCGLRCMRKQRRRLALRMKMHFSDKAAHSFIPNFRILNAISILPPLRRDPAFGFPY